MNFTKADFRVHAGYVTYLPTGKVIARFKRGGASTFVTHLVKHHTVEGYFAEVAEGKRPLDIVGATGYLLPHVKRWLKAAGLPLTQEGWAQYRARLTWPLV